MPLTLTRRQVRLVDQLAVERYGMHGLVLMENAGRGAAEIIDQRFGPSSRCIVLCGTGNNGGDGCVIARHLHNRGWNARVVVIGPIERMSDDMRSNFDIVQRMGLTVSPGPNGWTPDVVAQLIRPDNVVVDALLGTGFSGEVREPTCGVIHAVNAAPKRATIAVDLPSGLDCDSGLPGNAAIRAQLTVTFVARKKGFDHPSAIAYTGEVAVADIGAPKELVDEISRMTE